MNPEKKKFSIPYTKRDHFFDVMTYIFKVAFFYGVMYIGMTALNGYIGCLVFSIGLVSSLYVIYSWLRLNFTELCCKCEITKLGNTFLVRNRKGYIYFKRNDIISATVQMINDANYLLTLKLKQCFFYKTGLFNEGYIVFDAEQINIADCDPAEFLNALYPLPLNYYTLKYDEDSERSSDGGKIVYFSANSVSAELKFSDKEELGVICANTFDLTPDKLF